MSAVPVIIESAPCASRHFHAILAALLNASNDEYEERLADVLDYVSTIEAARTVTDVQVSIRQAMALKENERKAIRKALAKLGRFGVRDDGMMTTEDLGDWVSFYDVIQAVK